MGFGTKMATIRDSARTAITKSANALREQMRKDNLKKNAKIGLFSGLYTALCCIPVGGLFFSVMAVVVSSFTIQRLMQMGIIPYLAFVAAVCMALGFLHAMNPLYAGLATIPFTIKMVHSLRNVNAAEWMTGNVTFNGLAPVVDNTPEVVTAPA